MLGILREFELELQKLGADNLANHFDLIVGNSFGGFIAARLSQGATVDDCLVDASDEGFMYLYLTGVPWFIGNKWSSITGLLKRIFNDQKLATLRNCAIPTVDYGSGEVRLWSGLNSPEDPENSMEIASVVAGSLCNPQFLCPPKVEITKNETAMIYDSALTMGNPSRFGLDLARRHFTPTPLIRDIRLVSVDTSSFLVEPRPRIFTTAYRYIVRKLFPKMPVFNLATLVDHLEKANHKHSDELCKGLFREIGMLENYFSFAPGVSDATPGYTFDPRMFGDYITVANEYGLRWAQGRKEEIQIAAEKIMGK